MSDQRPPPRDLQGLLRLAVENQVARDGGEATVGDVQATNNDHLWLGEAVSSFQNDPVAEMKKGIDCIQHYLDEAKSSGLTEKVEQDLMYTLETLVDYVGSIDFANDFNKLGGMSLVVPLLELTSTEIKAKSCELFAELVQNNPTAQQVAIEGQILATLVKILDDDSNVVVQIKSLYAISCLIRENLEAQNEFDSKLDGLSVLLRAMQQETESHKLRIKSSFLITSLSQTSDTIKENLFKMGFVEQIIALLHSEHNASHEFLLGALHTLVTCHEGSKQEARRPELRLNQLLLAKATSLVGRPELSEERYFANAVNQICFPPGEAMEEER